MNFNREAVRKPDHKLLRCLDLILATIGLVTFMPIMIGLYAVGLLDTGSPIFIQIRIGRNQKPFRLLKFRTMHVNTASVATHLANKESVTRFGKILRRSKLDELPQLWNVVKGEMSLVGPRPCLYSQTELISERTKLGVFDARPGITGLAQINGIDMSTPRILAEMDAEMLSDLHPVAYFSYLFKTIAGAGRGDRIKHQ